MVKNIIVSTQYNQHFLSDLVISDNDNIVIVILHHPASYTVSGDENESKFKILFLLRRNSQAGDTRTKYPRFYGFFPCP